MVTLGTPSLWGCVVDVVCKPRVMCLVTLMHSFTRQHYSNLAITMSCTQHHVGGHPSLDAVISPVCPLGLSGWLQQSCRPCVPTLTEWRVCLSP